MLIIIALHMMRVWIAHLASPVTWDYGPAQLAIHVARFVNGAPLYSDFRIAPFSPLVYGPIVPTMTAIIAPIFGGGPMAALEAGRLLTVASALLTCAMIFVVARKCDASGTAAIIATLGFLLAPIVLRWGFEYRVDMPALACELVGIAAFANSASVAALAMFAAAFFIKQGHAVGIATVVVFCWLSGERRRAATWGIMWLLAVGAGTALLATIYPYYFLNTFGAVRTLRFDFAAPLLFLGILIGGNLGLTIFASIALSRRAMRGTLIPCFAIVALLHDLASCLRWGSNAYYFLPALAAMAIAAAAGVDLFLKRARTMSTMAQALAGAAIAMLFALGFILAPRTITTRATPEYAWDPLALARLLTLDGPIVTDTAELKLVDTQPNLQWIDLMVLTSMQQLGTFDDRALIESIERRRIAAFALDPQGLRRNYRGRAMFWPRLRRAIKANYEAAPDIGPPLLMLRKNR